MQTEQKTENEAFMNNSKWLDAETADVTENRIYLGCHHHDNWYSLIYKKNDGKWYNDWDETCECWPSHIMELPNMPYSE